MIKRVYIKNLIISNKAAVINMAMKSHINIFEYGTEYAGVLSPCFLAFPIISNTSVASREPVINPPIDKTRINWALSIKERIIISKRGMI